MKVQTMNNLFIFLATTWNQGVFFNLVGGSGACGRCMIALTGWLDILLERTMKSKSLSKTNILVFETKGKLAQIQHMVAKEYKVTNKKYICYIKKRLKAFKHKQVIGY